MRIIGGSHSGRRFSATKGKLTRPTSDRVREALFSALEARNAIVGQSVLDLFAGTGALAFESLSRGASSAALCELDGAAMKLIKSTAREFDMTPSCRFWNFDAFCQVGRIKGSFNLVFLDPPYRDCPRLPTLVGELAKNQALEDGALVCVEHPTKEPVELADLSIDGFLLDHEAQYKYGDTSIALWRFQRIEQA